MIRSPRSESRVHAIVPVNVIKRSKMRLSSLLIPASRERLTLAMLTDVLRALRKSKEVRDVTVVSADPKIPPIARRYGARFLWERNRRGLNSALRLALRNVESKGDGTVLIVHADLPLLTSRDINRLVARSKGYELAIVPCKSGRGTNALLMRHPNTISVAFGRGSFRKHVSHARKRKVRYKIIRIAGIGFDVDEPRDLQWLIRRRVASEAQRVLQNLRLRRPFALGES